MLGIIPLRVALKLVDLRSADVVRSVKRGADDAGPAVSEATFPGGVTPIIKPFGQTEIDALRMLEGRSAAASGWSEREAQTARVAAIRTAYEAALTNRKNAMIAAANLRALRDTAKEDFLDASAAVAGEIQGVFPRDAPVRTCSSMTCAALRRRTMRRTPTSRSSRYPPEHGGLRGSGPRIGFCRWTIGALSMRSASRSSSPPAATNGAVALAIAIA